MTTSPIHANALRVLRNLVPQRTLHFSEAMQLVELQANRLRQLLGCTEAELSELYIAELPRLVIRRAVNLPASGAAQWCEGQWIITLNSSEPETRQHFSLAHELFHIINHTTKERLHPADLRMSAHRKGERLADYFAGCLLMPKRHVKPLAARGSPSEELADIFGVSVRAMEVRLSQLGITEPRSRCERPFRGYRRVLPQTALHLPDTVGTVA